MLGDTKFNMSVMKNCLMLQNARFTAFTVSELLRESLHWEVKIPPKHPD